MADHIRTMDFVAIRDQFPGASVSPYLDASARSLLYGGARAVFDSYLDQNGAGTLDKHALFEGVEETRRLFAALIRAEADEIAFTRNVTDGIAAIAACLPWRAGDNVVLCETLEHPANVYPWRGIARRMGIEIRGVAPDAGHIPIDAILEAADSRTKVITVSAVSFAPGFRLPLGGLGAECRRRGILLVVDGAQSVGVLDTDVKALNIDVLAASAQKYLMGVYGVGFLYVRRELAETLEPVFVSRFSVDLGDRHEGDAGDPSDYRLAAGARRFDVGNYNFPATLAVGASLRLLLDLGQREVESYVCGLASDFASRLMDAGVPVFGGRTNAAGSQIVTAGSALGAGHDGTDDHDMTELHDFLTENGVRLGIRRGLLRFSFHVYNNTADIEKVIGLVRAWREKRPAMR